MFLPANKVQYSRLYKFYNILYNHKKPQCDTKFKKSVCRGSVCMKGEGKTNTINSSQSDETIKVVTMKISDGTMYESWIYK